MHLKNYCNCSESTSKMLRIMSGWLGTVTDYFINIASPIATVTHLNRTFVIGNCIYNTPDCASSQSYIRKFLRSVPPQSFIRCFMQAFSLFPDQPGNLIRWTLKLFFCFLAWCLFCHTTIMLLQIRFDLCRTSSRISASFQNYSPFIYSNLYSCFASGYFSLSTLLTNIPYGLLQTDPSSHL